MKNIKILLALIGLSIGTAAVADTLTNESIITLVGAGLSDEAIVAKIKTSDQHFDLSTDQMIGLKKAGVSGNVIAAMLERTAPAPQAEPVRPKMSMDSPDPMVPHPSGVYLLDRPGASAKMQRIDATVTNQAKTGGIFGYALTAGIASMSVKAAIQNETARVSTNGGQPTFYFFFDESNPETANASSWVAGTTTVVTSPNEFTLIRLIQKKGRREARVGSVNIGGAKTGVMDKDRISFHYQMVRPGVFKVEPDEMLEAGEYGFISSFAGGGQAGAMTARIFDFSVS